MPAVNLKHSFDTVYDAQKTYRLILSAMANPTQSVNIKAYAGRLFGETPCMLALAMTLLDNEVSFATADNQQLADDITPLTLSRQTQIDQADYIFVTDDVNLDEAISKARFGTLTDPHQSAVLIVRNTGSPSRSLRFCGPGIKGTIHFMTTDLVQKAIAIRDSQYYEYPQGIDFIFLTDEGDLFAIPRLIRMEVR